MINIASLSSFVSFHEVAAYSASKAAVASLTLSLAIELARKGERVMAYRADGAQWRDLGRPESVEKAAEEMAAGMYGG